MERSQDGFMQLALVYASVHTHVHICLLLWYAATYIVDDMH